MFSFLKKKEEVVERIELPEMEVDGDKEILCSPVEGEIISCSQIKDLTFQKEMLGTTVALKPSVGKVYAPADGKIEMMIETLHAISLTTEKGTEILIHIGIDTVGLKGKYYKGYVKAGKEVKRGDLLLEFDIERIQKEGYDLTSPVIICNTEEYETIERVEKSFVKVGETIMKLKKATV